MVRNIMMAICMILISFILADPQPSAAKADAPAPPAAKTLRVLDISERTYEGGPAISVLLSEPLDPEIRHDADLRISDPEGLLKSAWVLSEDHRSLYFPHVEPEREYSVSVLETMTAASGNMLTERVSQTVETRQIVPIASFASEGLLLPAKMTRGLPVVTVNIKHVEIEFFRLNGKALVNFVNWKNTTGRRNYYKLGKIKEYGSLVFSGRFDLDAPRNKRTICHLPVEDIEGLQEPGVYLAVMRKPGEYAYTYETTYFLVTDIGLHARIYEKETLIIASSLKSGDPLPDAKLSFYDKEGNSVGKGVTDANGRYRYPENLVREARIIKAAHGGHISILPLNIPALDMSEFKLGKRGYQAREIYVYSPRDLYRPGETVILSALLRSYDGGPVKSLPIKAKLFQADDKEVRSFTWHVSDGDNGLKAAGVNYYQSSLELPKDAQTGLWHLKLWDNPSSKKPNTVFEFHVEEFLPERMKVELRPSASAFKPEDDLEIDILGEYLYGAPASGNNLSARVRVKAKRDLMDSLKGFQFGDVKDETYKDSWELEDQALDNQGKTHLTIESRWAEIRSPLAVRVIASLYESGGRPVRRGIDQMIWPGDALVGIRPLFDDEKSVDAGPVNFEVVRVRPDGTQVSASNLMVDLIKEDRDYYWEYSESNGWDYKYTEKHYQFLTDTLSLDGDKPAAYTLNLQHGQYVLAIKDPESNLVTSLRFRVGHWWYGEDQGTAARPDKVLLKPDKAAYRPGDVIQLTVTPPHDGDGIILVEGDHPLWFRRMKVSAKGTKVEIPVSPKWDRHDLYLSAVVFRPASAEKKITPNRAVGLIHLPLERSRRKLDVEIQAPEKVASQGPMTVTLKLVSPKATAAPIVPVNQKCFVTLAAVDVGILNITEFETPDPFAWFFEQRRYSVSSYDIYAKVIENMDGGMARLRYGGDADSGGKRPESEVKLLSLFQAPVTFDENGEAEVTFDLPDFNGKVRLMAIAFDKNSFGSSEAEVIVAAPTVTQLAIPRFLAPGDATELTLDIHNLSGQEQQLNVAVNVTSPLRLENSERVVHLFDQEKTVLRFPVTASPDYAYGTSKILLHLEGEGITLERDWKLGVRPGYPAIARKVRKVLKGKIGETTGDEKQGSASQNAFTLGRSLTANMIPSTVEAGMKISPVIPLDIQNAMKGLIGYPYGCLEQTTSQAYPLLFATPENISKYDLPPISHGERIGRLDKAIQRLSTMQLASGGFGLWNRNSPETPWLTAYATDFLLRAREMGVDVPETMTDTAFERLEAYMRKGPPLPDYGSAEELEHLDFAVRAYAAHVLAKVDWADLGTLRTLYDNHREQAGSSLPLAHLGIALQKMGDTRRSADAFVLATKKRCRRYGYWGDYGSLVRDLALSLSLLIEHDAAETEGFDTLMLDLETELRNRRWLSTQEKFAIFKAGLSLESQANQIWKGKLTIAGKESVLNQSGSHYIPLDVKQLSRGITFISDTPEFLYASAIVSGYTKTPPEKDDSHISIKREWYDAEGNPIDRDAFKVGELLLAHLRIHAKEWLPDALVVDLLPAGFELENQNLKHSVKLDEVTIEGKALWHLKEQTNVVHEEYRDDRYVAVVELSEHHPTHLFYLLRVVSPGKYSVPPPFAESMYRPEIRGIGDTPAPIRVLNQNEGAEEELSPAADPSQAESNVE
ncbi:MAG: hypothetical protein B6245_06385 [Desulfobacteraceae bacterium 4572_88]|nr:MAG: hypothetical protein B6245_06385 [Desulfobacteraceae bacterium 4572_88]